MVALSSLVHIQVCWPTFGSLITAPSHWTCSFPKPLENSLCFQPSVGEMHWPQLINRNQASFINEQDQRHKCTESEKGASSDFQQSLDYMIEREPRTSWNCHNSWGTQFSQSKLMGVKGKAGKGLRWNLVISCYRLSQQTLQHLFFSLLCWTAIALINSSFLRSKVWHLYNTPKGFLNIIALPFSNE